jgi:hypothetical protein
LRKKSAFGTLWSPRWITLLPTQLPMAAWQRARMACIARSSLGDDCGGVHMCACVRACVWVRACVDGGCGHSAAAAGVVRKHQCVSGWCRLHHHA